MTILDKIVAHKRTEIENMEDIQNPKICKMDFDKLFEPSPCIIAELKAASPSEGIIAENFNPSLQAQYYINGRANAISILTDYEFFKGSFDVLEQIRDQTKQPLLCKEFIIEEKQIRYARACGADLVLLIVKILDDDRLLALKQEIEKWGMKALIEIQNDDELERALKTEPELLLINNRNLSSFDVDMSTTEKLLDGIPDDVRVIAASGIQSPDDLKNFSARVDGFLIGTSLMRSDNPEKFLRDCRDG